jgi:hypothetical protein
MMSAFHYLMGLSQPTFVVKVNLNIQSSPFYFYWRWKVPYVDVKCCLNHHDEILKPFAGKKLPSSQDDTWYSIFPVENEDLVYGRSVVWSLWLLLCHLNCPLSDRFWTVNWLVHSHMIGSDTLDCICYFRSWVIWMVLSHLDGPESSEWSWVVWMVLLSHLKGPE